MPFETRLRQVVLVAPSLEPVSDQLRSAFGLEEGYHDPGVEAFGLCNVVYAVGDRFIEVVSPVREGTTAGRLLDRDGPGGYMAIFQVSDLAAARRRVGDLGVRIVWEIALDDIAAMHLHPKDVPGAIVSIDQASPPTSWRWAGPAWIGGGASERPGGVRGITVRVDDPPAAAERWGAVLAVEPADAAFVLDGGRQQVSFVPAGGARPGISRIELEVPGAEARSVDIGGVTFAIR